MELQIVIKKEKGLLYIYDFPIHCTHATVQPQIKYHVIPTFLFSVFCSPHRGSGLFMWHIHPACSLNGCGEPIPAAPGEAYTPNITPQRQFLNHFPFILSAPGGNSPRHSPIIQTPPDHNLGGGSDAPNMPALCHVYVCGVVLFYNMDICIIYSELVPKRLFIVLQYGSCTCILYLNNGTNPMTHSTCTSKYIRGENVLTAGVNIFIDNMMTLLAGVCRPHTPLFDLKQD